MADEEEEISWSYRDDLPYLGVRLSTPAGKEYPLVNEEQVLIDTGFSEEILLPKNIYEQLGLNMWEAPESEGFKLVDGTSIDLIPSKGYLLIPKLRAAPFPVIVHKASNEIQDTNEIIIGAKFIKRFKLLLDGPADKTIILS